MDFTFCQLKIFTEFTLYFPSPDWLPDTFSVDFIIVSRQMTQHCHKLGRDSFLPYPFQVIQ